MDQRRHLCTSLEETVKLPPIATKIEKLKRTLQTRIVSWSGILSALSLKAFLLSSRSDLSFALSEPKILCLVILQEQFNLLCIEGTISPE